MAYPKHCMISFTLFHTAFTELSRTVISPQTNKSILMRVSNIVGQACLPVKVFMGMCAISGTDATGVHHRIMQLIKEVYMPEVLWPAEMVTNSIPDCRGNITPVYATTMARLRQWAIKRPVRSPVTGGA